MQELSFEYPEAFFLLALFILCQIFCRRIAVRRYFPHLHFFSRVHSWMSWQRLLRYLLALLLVTAIASPILIDHRHPDNRNGYDLVLCIDSSGSMGDAGFDTKAGNISKFESVRRIAGAFILGRRNDNVGLVFFGDFAYIASPLTYEKEALVEFLGYQDMTLAGRNTAIGDGLARSLEVLESSHAKTRLIVLLSDGEQNAGSVSVAQMAQAAARNGIRIYTIAVGETADVALMERIAADTGGQAFVAKDARTLESVYEAIDGMEPSELRSRDYAAKHYFYAYPAWGALAVLLLYATLLFRRVRI